MPVTQTIYRASEIVRAEEERHKAWLHDTVLQMLEYIATGGYGECVDIERLMGVAAHAADDLREAIDGSGSMGMSHADFLHDLHEVTEEARLLSDMQVCLDVSEAIDPVEAHLGSELVAVVREALTNIRKHSRATNVEVQCTTGRDGIELCIVDDGIGFDLLSVREGVGIRTSMRGRMARCGGYVVIASAPGRGTVVRISVDRPAGAVAESVA